MDQVLLIFGSFISLLLMTNAYFTRKTLESISDVRLKLAVLIQKHDATDERSRWNQMEIEKIRERLHSLEGQNANLLQFIDDFSKKKG